MSAKTKTIDHGWLRIQRELKLAKKSFVKVGFPENGEAKSGNKKGSGHEPLEMGDIVTVASVHEFGAPNKNIPVRSFMRSSYDENREEINRVIEKSYDGILAGKETVYWSLQKIGVWFTAKVQKKIRDLREPPNAPSTIARKGSSNPLIDTGQMIQSVQHEVVINGKK